MNIKKLATSALLLSSGASASQRCPNSPIIKTQKIKDLNGTHEVKPNGDLVPYRGNDRKELSSVLVVGSDQETGKREAYARNVNIIDNGGIKELTFDSEDKENICNSVDLQQGSGLERINLYSDAYGESSKDTVVITKDVPTQLETITRIGKEDTLSFVGYDKGDVTISKKPENPTNPHYGFQQTITIDGGTKLDITINNNQKQDDVTSNNLEFVKKPSTTAPKPTSHSGAAPHPAPQQEQNAFLRGQLAQINKSASYLASTALPLALAGAALVLN